MINRLKYLRKGLLKLSQKEFGRQIGLSATGLGEIEKGRNSFSERYVKLICQTFNVREEWLRDGIEPIFNEDKENSSHINDLINRYNINLEEINIIKRLINLDENTRNKIINFIFEIVKDNIDKIDETKIPQFSNTQQYKIKILDRGEDIK